MPAFVAKHGIDWPVAVDARGETVEALLVDSYPDYYLIDRAGRLRVADLANGDLDRAVQMLLDEPAPVWVEPSASADLGEVPYVGAFVAEDLARAGSPVHVEVRGSFPSAGWTFAGFQLERAGEGARDLILTPRANPPDALAAQVLQAFTAVADVLILEPGDYRVFVRGRGEGELPPATVGVLPSDALLRLRIQGGILGFDERLDLRASGRAIFHSNRRGGPREIEVSPDKLARIVERLERLPADPQSPPPTLAASDLISYELSYWCGGRMARLRVDDLNAGELAPLIELLRALP
jgi:hypothetical protein